MLRRIFAYGSALCMCECNNYCWGNGCVMIEFCLMKDAE